MRGAAERAKLELELQLAEAEFEQSLASALRSCVSGHWGLFGHNGERWDEGKTLIAQGDEISELRKRLGNTQGFWLYQRFIAYRSEHGANAPGEPKLAQRFLDEIAEQEKG